MRKVILLLIMSGLLIWLTGNGITLQTLIIVLKINGSLELTPGKVFWFYTSGQLISAGLWWLFYKLGKGINK